MQTSRTGWVAMGLAVLLIAGGGWAVFWSSAASGAAVRPASGPDVGVVYLAPDPQARYPGAYSVAELREAGWTVVSDTTTLHAVVRDRDEPPNAIVIHGSRITETSGTWLFAQIISSTVIGGVNLSTSALARHMDLVGYGLTGAETGDVREPSAAFRDFWSWIDFSTETPITSPDMLRHALVTCWREGWEWHFMGPQLYAYSHQHACGRPVPTPDYTPIPWPSPVRTQTR